MDLPAQGAVHADTDESGLPEPGRSEREAPVDRGRRRPHIEPGINSSVEFAEFRHEFWPYFLKAGRK